MFKGTEWKKNTLKAAFMFPQIIFCIFFVLNGLVWDEKKNWCCTCWDCFFLVFYGLEFSCPGLLLEATLATRNMQLKIQ